jgi:1,4-alpha-glucan branching enzyme
MGAMPLPNGGFAFRVWAKFAQDVHVVGDFNGGSDTATPLFPEGNGNWSADVPAAKVGQQYRYLIKGMDGQDRRRTDPRALRVNPADTGNAEGMIVAPDFFWDSGSFGMAGFNELVIYELHIESFHDPAEPGTFDTLIGKLPYLQELGINAIELLPIFGHFGQHSLGYNPAFPFDIESNFGSNDGFKRFIRAAHDHGIAVIMDVVYNHFGWEELDLSLQQPDGWSKNGSDGIYFYADDPRKSGGFGPRPDFGRPEVRDYIRDNIRLWLEQYHVDGFRFDAVTLIRNAHDQDFDPGNDIPEGIGLLQDIGGIIKNQPSAKISIAEDLKDDAWIVQRGNGGLGFDSQWASEFYWAIHDNAVAVFDEQRSMARLRDAVERGFNADAYSRVGFTETHDSIRQDRGHARIPEEIAPGNGESWPGKKRSTLAAGFVLTTPCIPMLFQEQELLATGAWSPGDNFDWSRRNQLDGIFRLYRDLIRLRRNFDNNTRGLRGQHVHVHHLNDNDKVIALHRWDQGGPGDDVVVVMNFGHQQFDTYSLGFPGPGLWWCRLNSDASTYDGSFGNFGSTLTVADPSDPADPDHMPCRARIGIAPYSLLIFSQ